MNVRLQNKVSIITGSSSGIGREAAYLFGKHGAKIVVVDIHDAGGEETVYHIRANGGEAIYVKADVSGATDMRNVMQKTVGTFGRIDILFNNAGIPGNRAKVENVDEEFWDKTYAVHVKGIFLAVKYAVPEMRKTGGGVILSTGSMQGVRPRVGYAAFASAKGAVNVLTKELALELAPEIRVNCINPCPIFTPMTGGSFTPQMEKDILELPLKRGGKPEDVAYAALYLSSDESAFITGSCINVDGGRAL
ncbi:MAG: SDR family oxidoreductase [Deltaproteobacteria bacterium]|nr:SDR family oxidoreductase [Deltaproteobacteria bacterium]